MNKASWRGRDKRIYRIRKNKRCLLTVICLLIFCSVIGNDIRQHMMLSFLRGIRALSLWNTDNAGMMVVWHECS